jgi:glyoxylase-like metal-dependent hydrolase (beta-lactamase superfamily II)
VTRRSRGAPTKALFAQQNVDFSKVEIKTTELGNKTYMLQGQGGNITVAVGTDGAIMVDSEFAPLHDKIKAAIEKISPLPIKYLIDTHYHGDHTGGNALFHKDGAPAVLVRARLSRLIWARFVLLHSAQCARCASTGATRWQRGAS